MVGRVVHLVLLGLQASPKKVSSFSHRLIFMVRIAKARAYGQTLWTHLNRTTHLLPRNEHLEMSFCIGSFMQLYPKQQPHCACCDGPGQALTSGQGIVFTENVVDFVRNGRAREALKWTIQTRLDEMTVAVREVMQDDVDDHIEHVDELDARRYKVFIQQPRGREQFDLVTNSNKVSRHDMWSLCFCGMFCGIGLVWGWDVVGYCCGIVVVCLWFVVLCCVFVVCLRSFAVCCGMFSFVVRVLWYVFFVCCVNTRHARHAWHRTRHALRTQQRTHNMPHPLTHTHT